MSDITSLPAGSRVYIDAPAGYWIGDAAELVFALAAKTPGVRFGLLFNNTPIPIDRGDTREDVFNTYEAKRAAARKARGLEP